MNSEERKVKSEKSKCLVGNGFFTLHFSFFTYQMNTTMPNITSTVSDAFEKKRETYSIV